MMRTTVARSIRPYTYRPLSRTPLQPSLLTSTSISSAARTSTPQRTVYTSSKRTVGSRFRGFVGRFGLAVAIVYWYNTGGVWAEEPADKQPLISRAPPVVAVPEEHFASLDELDAEKKKKKQQQTDTKKDGVSESLVAVGEPRSPESLEEEAGQQGAFNEETGEINWECPCLGGMAHGPCGDEFRAAFSCFVFSKEEPKGVDCIEKFKGMQTCFQKFPEIYGDPPADDEDEEEEIDRKIAELDSRDSSSSNKSTTSPPSTEKEPKGDKPSPEPKRSDSTPTGSLPRPAPEDKGTDEFSHDAPKDNAGSKPGTLSHPGPGEKGIGGGAHEGPVDTDAATSGLTRPAPSSSGLDGGLKGHGAPGVKGVSDPAGPRT